MNNMRAFSFGPIHATLDPAKHVWPLNRLIFASLEQL